MYVGNRCVIDIYGAEKERNNYNADSLISVFGSGQSIAAILMAIIHDRGLINYGDFVWKYWYEFRKDDKNLICIEDVLRHEAGL